MRTTKKMKSLLLNEAAKEFGIERWEVLTYAKIASDTLKKVANTDHSFELSVSKDNKWTLSWFAGGGQWICIPVDLSDWCDGILPLVKIYKEATGIFVA